MNAKKIMGAVLVALLAAALFVGAGAAATDYGTQYTYVPITDFTIKVGDTFSTSNGQTIMAQTVGTGVGFALTEGSYVPNAKYSDGTVEFKLTAPNANVFIVDANGKSVVDGTAFTTDELTFSVGINKAITTTTLGYNDLVFISPEGVETVGLPDVKAGSTAGAYDISDVAAGKWGVKVDISGVVAVGGPAYSSVYYFTIAEATETIAADKEEVLVGGTVSVTVTGIPGDIITITYDEDDLTVVPNQPVDVSPTPATTDEVDVKLGADGKATIAFTGKADGKTTVQISSTKKVEITVKKGTILVTSGAEIPSVFIGNKVDIEGTYEGGKNVYYFIQGTNYDFDYLGYESVKADNTWKVTIDTAADLTIEPDAGTYTVFIASFPTEADAKAAQGVDNLDIYTAVSVALKQPFISLTDAPTVAVKGEKYTVEGTAEAATSVSYYIFGTNKFIPVENVPVDDEGVFTIEQPITDMAAGQYFMVVQHPMYDGNFNIQATQDANGKWIIEKAATKADGQLDTAVKLFTVDLRQTTNAAQALCNALDAQDIDDMYVKHSFVVAAATSVINPIASEVTKGSKLTVSGYTNAGAGKVVTVDMVSTAFAAVPKETVGSASFITLTTKTLEDGTWEVVFDTTGLNVDEYTVSVAITALDTSASTKVNVIEGAPTENPTEQPTENPTEQPTEQPTEAPATPGFGALAALAGLGAVAVLLLRRE